MPWRKSGASAWRINLLTSLGGMQPNTGADGPILARGNHGDGNDERKISGESEACRSCDGVTYLDRIAGNESSWQEVALQSFG